MKKQTRRAAVLILLFNFIVFTLGIVPFSANGSVDRSGIAIWLMVMAVVNFFSGLFSLMVGMGRVAWRPYAFCMFVVAGALLLFGMLLLHTHDGLLFN